MLVTIIMLLGVIYGFVLPGGPIIWGLAGLLAGSGLGYAIDRRYNHKHDAAARSSSVKSEVILMVRCERSGWVEKLIWEHKALGVAHLQLHS